MWLMNPDRESSRIFSDAAADVAMSASNYLLFASRLTAANYFEALQFANRIAGSSNGAEIVKLSAAQHSAQVKAMREHADSLFEFGRGILGGATLPFKKHLMTACCVIL